MPLYFRSDTRSLEIIQNTGFTPREDHDDKWWLEAVRADKPSEYLRRKKSNDAVKSACVSLSTKLESTVLFPDEVRSADTIYVYAIALPSATKLEYNENGELLLPHEENSPTDIKQKVIDLHSLQATQVGNIVSAEPDNSVNKYCSRGLHAYSGWPLYAYEALAYKVPPENIICVIEVKRQHLDSTVIYNPWEMSKMLMPRKKFKMVGEIIINEHFNPIQNYLFGDINDSRQVSIDYSAEKDQALEIISELKAKDNLETPSVRHGLGGKTF